MLIFGEEKVWLKRQDRIADAALKDLLGVTRGASPVYDSVANPVAIQSRVERMQ